MHDTATRVTTAPLTPLWAVTTEHPASSYGIPVLVHRTTGAAYGHDDLVTVHPTLPPQSGRRLVEKLLRAAQGNLEMAELQLVSAFLNQESV